MEEFLSYIWDENIHWGWWALSAILFSLEVFLPTFFLLWPAIAGIFVGAIAFFFPDFIWQYQVILFTVLSVVITVLGRHYFTGRLRQETDHPTLNQPEQALVGRIVQATEKFNAGQGYAEINDSRWRAMEVDKRQVKAGDHLEVIAVENMTLQVKKADN